MKLCDQRLLFIITTIPTATVTYAYAFVVFFMHATCFAHLILLDVVTLNAVCVADVYVVQFSHTL
jgi:hypothetical protein